MGRYALALTLVAALAAVPGCRTTGTDMTRQMSGTQPASRAGFSTQRDVAAIPVKEAESKVSTMSYHTRIFAAARANKNFRKVLVTTEHTQVVLMSLAPGESIGHETHSLDQILVFIAGTGRYEIGKAQGAIRPGDLFVVPAHTPHDFLNTGDSSLKLFTIYSPPAHPPGTLQRTKQEAVEKHHY